MRSMEVLCTRLFIIAISLTLLSPYSLAQLETHFHEKCKIDIHYCLAEHEVCEEAYQCTLCMVGSVQPYQSYVGYCQVCKKNLYETVWRCSYCGVIDYIIYDYCH